MTKDFIRKQVLSIRKLLNRNEVILKSKNVMHTLLNIKEINTANSIMCYIDFDNEVITSEFIKFAMSSGKQVSIPYINSSTNEMVASLLTDFGGQLVCGKYGILCPNPTSIMPISPESLDVVIVPGIAFDKNKNRIGYGKGYYDRFLAKTNKNCIKIGLSFDFQIYDDLIPNDSHDVLMDIVVCESFYF